VNDERRQVCENFRCAMKAVSTGADAYPLYAPLAAIEWATLEDLAYRITRGVCADPQTDDERAWRRAGQATLALMAHAPAGDRDRAIAQE
jgi:hypothetical protein